MSLTYVTSNQDKIKVAQRYLAPLGIHIENQHLDLEEIQSNSGEEIIKRKAKQAFHAIQKPLIVTDHFWNIPALQGFPGAYMKYINQWFTTQDFLNLMREHTNRTVFLEEHLFFTDGKIEKLFFQPIKGTILTQAKGSHKEPAHTVISLREDHKSIAECWEQGINSVDNYPIWTEFSIWYKTQITK
jgi:XTP/dITP diphosphohydrolase